MAAPVTPPRVEAASKELLRSDNLGPSSQPSPGAASSSDALSPCAGRADPNVNKDIQRLLEEQKRVREERKRLALELRNAQRRRRRLKHKARLLSHDDLQQVMALRAEEEEDRGKKAKRRNSDVDAGGTQAAELTASIRSVDDGARSIPAEDQE